MSPKMVTTPELGMIAGTRMALGASIGFLLADYLAPEQRRAVGWTLVGVGLISTLPLAAQVFLQNKPAKNGSAHKPKIAEPQEEPFVASP